MVVLFPKRAATSACTIESSCSSRSVSPLSVLENAYASFPVVLLIFVGGTVTATVHAQSAEAAAVLQQGADDLRRGLEAQGLQLAGLEIRQDMSDPGANPGQGSAGGFVAGPRGTAPSDDSTEITIDPSRVPLDGSQLDVLA